ncbi:MAG TPA: hypothetical protein DEA90_03630 [Opitutae bacterium]|nr:hypothetical protein [Puniceicoccaceae bacterium]HBR93235.1 hypothetical protein [Opitutae bacterium]
MMFDWIEPLTIPIFVEALLHTLWVGAFCALGLFFVLKQLQVRRVHVRYGAGLLAFSVISLSLPVGVAVLSAPEQASAVAPAGASAVPAAIEPSSSLVESERSIASELASWEAWGAESPEAGERASWEVFVFRFWILGSCLGCIRIVCSLRGAVRLRRGGEPVTHLGMADLCERFGLRRVVPVFSTALSGVPAVCGLFKPVILFPISQLTALAPAQLEAILAHELAHIRRCDHLVNFVQLVMEALLFFNPFLWWVSGQVRQEREAACDALAVEVTGERLSYVQTLADVAAGQLSAGAAATVSFAGHSSGSLLDRVKRLLRPTASSELRLRLPMVCALLLAALCAFVATQWVAQVTVRALTPEERIERVDAVHEVYPQYAVEPIGWDELKGEEPQLSGQLLRPDGTPLQQGVPFYSYVRSGRGSMLSSQRTGPDGHFEFKVRPGDVSLLFLAEG